MKPNWLVLMAGRVPKPAAPAANGIVSNVPKTTNWKCRVLFGCFGDSVLRCTVIGGSTRSITERLMGKSTNDDNGKNGWKKTAWVFPNVGDTAWQARNLGDCTAYQAFCLLCLPPTLKRLPSYRLSKETLAENSSPACLGSTNQNPRITNAKAPQAMRGSLSSSSNMPQAMPANVCE